MTPPSQNEYTFLVTKHQSTQSNVEVIVNKNNIGQTYIKGISFKDEYENDLDFNYYNSTNGTVYVLTNNNYTTYIPYNKVRVYIDNEFIDEIDIVLLQYDNGVQVDCTFYDDQVEFTIWHMSYGPVIDITYEVLNGAFGKGTELTISNTETVSSSTEGTQNRVQLSATPGYSCGVLISIRDICTRVPFIAFKPPHGGGAAN